MYVVIGGVFTGTDFKDLETDTAEFYGPFETYEKAYICWKSRTSWKVDICCHRLYILDYEEGKEYALAASL
jgi:hypothetical protein